MSKYRTTWSEIQEQMNEFALSHTVRYRDPLNKKRFAVPFKTAEKAKEKMDQLKRDGVKEIEITKDTLRGKFKEDLDLQETNPMGYTVKFANRKGARIATAWYKDEADAKKALEMIKKNGGNGIISKGRWDEETIAEDGHTDVPSSKRMAQVIAEDAQLIIKELNKKSEEESLPTWWTNKLAVSAHNMNAARDYITDNIKEDLDEAMSPEQIKKLKDSWSDIKLMSPEKVKTLKNFLDKYSTDTLMQLAQSGINFVSNMARSVAMRRKSADPKHAGSHKNYKIKEEVSDSEKMAKMRVRQMALQTKLRNLDVGDPKDKTPIAITKNDLENIQMKMDQLKNKTQKEEVHPAKALIEAIEAVKNKAEKTGMPYSILKQVYDRGMAAWKGGHRPGTTPQQWALARVNSFVTKSSGTWGGADSDLAKKVRSKD